MRIVNVIGRGDDPRNPPPYLAEYAAVVRADVERAEFALSRDAETARGQRALAQASSFSAGRVMALVGKGHLAKAASASADSETLRRVAMARMVGDLEFNSGVQGHTHSELRANFERTFPEARQIARRIASGELASLPVIELQVIISHHGAFGWGFTRPAIAPGQGALLPGLERYMTVNGSSRPVLDVYLQNLARLDLLARLEG